MLRWKRKVDKMKTITVGEERQLELQKNEIGGRCRECKAIIYRDKTGACEKCYRKLKIRIWKLEKILIEIEKLLAYDD